MARTAGKKRAPAKIEEDDDAEGWEDAVVDADDKEAAANLRLRDWRDVERFREMRELRRLVDDDYGLEEIFHLPVKLKPRAEPGIPVPPTIARMLKPAAAAPTARPAAKTAPAKAVAAAKPAPANSRIHPKGAPAKAAPARPVTAKASGKSSARPRAEALKAKAKRR